MRTQANVTRKVPRYAPVNATTLVPHAPAPPPGLQATLPPTPNSSLAEHQRKDDSSDSSLTPASEASPDVTTSKVVPKQRPGRTPAATSRGEEASISSRPVGEQLAVRSCVIKGPSSSPSRSSSVPLEGLRAVHAGSPEGQSQVQDVGVEGLQLRVSPWSTHHLQLPCALQRNASLRGSRKVTTTQADRQRSARGLKWCKWCKTDCLKIKPKYLLVPLPLVPIVPQAIFCLILA